MSSSNDRHGIWTISNVITIIRILLVPVFVAALLAPWPEWFGMNELFSNNWKGIIAAGIFVLISCTDWLDGYLARSRKEVTDFGKFMDPLADKILVAAALIALVELGDLPTWVVLIILAREFIVSGVRMMAAVEGVVIAASMIGKFKTVFQIIAIVLFTIKDSHMIGSFSSACADALWVISWLFMVAALVLTIASMIDYLVKARDLIGLGARTAPSKSNDAQQAKRLEELSEQVVRQASSSNQTFCTAESLTGGLIGASVTNVPGASSAFKGSIVSYVNEVKELQLGVSSEVLEHDGAVSENTALQMAEGARSRLSCDVATSVTGIAGPGGAEPGKPVGTVWIATSTSLGTTARKFEFHGDRDEIRMQTVIAALEATIEALGDNRENL